MADLPKTRRDEPDLDPTSPLAEASKRLRGPSKKAQVPVDAVIALQAAGFSQNKIAKAFHVSDTTIENTLNRDPDAREKISTLREALKVQKLVDARRISPRLWARLDREIDEGDAKDIDALSRAVGAMEKVEASAAGEGQKVTVQGGVTNTNVELKALLLSLAGND